MWLAPPSRPSGCGLTRARSFRNRAAMIEPRGTVASRFARVREAFVENFARHGDSGAACAVYLDGQPVVDLWGGVADRTTGRPWEVDTPVIVFSATKGVTATAVHGLVERGVLDLDAPVAAYWPEFAAAGKGDVPLRWVLSHRAGLAAVAEDYPWSSAAAHCGLRDDPLASGRWRELPAWWTWFTSLTCG